MHIDAHVICVLAEDKLYTYAVCHRQQFLVKSFDFQRTRCKDIKLQCRLVLTFSLCMSSWVTISNRSSVRFDHHIVVQNGVQLVTSVQNTLTVSIRKSQSLIYAVIIFSTIYDVINWPAKQQNSVKQNAKLGLLRRSRSFKVIEDGINQMPVCDFLLVITTN